MYYIPSKSNSELVATCFFCKATNTVDYHSYDKYYNDKKK